MQMIIQNPTNQIGTLSMETLVVVLSIDDQFLLSVESKVSPLAIALFLKNTSGSFELILFWPIFLFSVYYRSCCWFRSIGQLDCDRHYKNNRNQRVHVQKDGRTSRAHFNKHSQSNTCLVEQSIRAKGCFLFIDCNYSFVSQSMSTLFNVFVSIKSTLDLITTVVRSSNQVPLSDLTMSAFIHVINLCLRVDETAILQVMITLLLCFEFFFILMNILLKSGGECLRAYLSKSIDQIINWKDEKGTSALSYIVLVINHMLDPKTSENSCSFIGKLINTLIRQTAHVLGDNLESILKAVLSKIQSSNILLVQQSLIMVFAHLVHSRMDAVLAFLSNLPGPTGKPVLEFLMTEWVSKQNSFVGPYESKIR